MDFFQLHRRVSRFDITKLKGVILLDWGFIICLGILAGSLESIRPFNREFSLNDKTIQFTFAVHETVPDWALLILAGLAPLVCIALINIVSVRSFWDLHAAWLGCILSILMTGIITDALKISTGRPRPDFIDRCQPKPGSVDHPIFGLSNASICTQTDEGIFYDGFKSFPSGHSSVSFAGLGFLAFYLAGKLHVFHEKGWFIKFSLILYPLIGAALIAVSRTVDNRHHWHDVSVGSSLGLCIAWLCYRQFFYPLASSSCHEALPPRSNVRQRPKVVDDNQRQESSESIQLQRPENRVDGNRIV